MPKLLFIGPKFYNYHETIKSGFEKAGFTVDYFDDRPDDKCYSSLVNR